LLVCPRRTALALLGHLFLAMSRHGQPNAIRTDNDAVFKSRVFRWGLSLIGVRHQFTTPGCPWQNGRIERVFGTLKRELDQLCVASGNVLAHLLDEFSVWYNEVRPHQHLDGATPMEVWRGIDPWRDRPQEVRWETFWDGRLAGYWLRR
jgi:transposase InsO family protein